MDSKRIRYGRCTFILPDGFAIQPEASHTPPYTSNCDHAEYSRRPSIYLTIADNGVDTNTPDFSESSEDLRPEVFPSSIVLTASKSMIHARPVEHLRKTEEVLQRYFKNLKIDFCKSDRVGEFQAARSQSSFETNFTIFRLNFAWLVDKELVTSTMTVGEPGVGKGWIDLRQFVESLRF